MRKQAEEVQKQQQAKHRQKQRDRGYDPDHTSLTVVSLPKKIRQSDIDSSLRPSLSSIRSHEGDLVDSQDLGSEETDMEDSVEDTP